MKKLICTICLVMSLSSFAGSGTSSTGVDGGGGDTTSGGDFSGN